MTYIQEYPDGSISYYNPPSDKQREAIAKANALRKEERKKTASENSLKKGAEIVDLHRARQRNHGLQPGDLCEVLVTSWGDTQWVRAKLLYLPIPEKGITHWQVRLEQSKRCVYIWSDSAIRVAELSDQWHENMGLASHGNFRKGNEPISDNTFSDVASATSDASVQTNVQNSMGVKVTPLDADGNPLSQEVLDVIDKIHEQKRLPIGRKARRQILSGIALMAKKRNRKSLAFLTCGYPDLSKKNEHLVILNWAKIVEGMNEDLKYRIETRGGIEYECVARTEINKKALLERRMIKYHIHFVFPGLYPNAVNKKKLEKEDWIISKDEINELFQKHVNKYIEDPCVITACNIQSVKKTLAGYLSKVGEYCSKDEGDELEKEAKKLGIQIIWPQQHYSMTRNVKKWIDEFIAEHKIYVDSINDATLVQLYETVSDPIFREKIRGLKVNVKPRLVTRTVQKWNQFKKEMETFEYPVAIVDYYELDSNPTETLADLKEHLIRWDVWNRANTA